MNVRTHSPERANALTRFLAKSDVYLLVLLAVAVAFICFYNLQRFPLTWLDEGWHLQMPKNLVQYGQYGVLNFEGSPVFSPDFAREMTTIFLPIALVFKLFGVGLLQARLVMATYLMLTVLFVYLVAKRVYDRNTAILAAFFFLFAAYSTDQFTWPAFLGRQVMGEVPAFFFFLVGYLLWLKTLDRVSFPLLFASGLCFGLAIVTKSWFAFLIWPTLIAGWLVDVIYYKQLEARHLAVPLAVSISCIVAWTILLYFILGRQDFAAHFNLIRSASSTSVALFSIRRVVSGLAFIIRSDFLVWGLPGLIYAAVLALDRKRTAITSSVLLLFIAISLIWFAFGSVAWARYAFPAFAMSNIFVAKLLRDLSDGLDLRKLLDTIRHPKTLDSITRVGATLILVCLVASFFVRTVEQVITAHDDTPQELADYVDKHLGQNVLTETAEWEISFLTQHSVYHHPSSQIVDVLTNHVYLGTPYSPDVYNFREYDPAYVIVGPFAKWTGLYSPDFLKQECTLIESIGEYDLYKVNASKSN